MIMHAKIVATMGPATNQPACVEKLIQLGLGVARLNLAHSSHGDIVKTIKVVREAAARSNQPVAIMADLAGPKIRTGPLSEESVELIADRHVVLTVEPTEGTSERIGVVYPNFAADVEPGQAILISDGLLKLVVEKVEDTDVLCRVEIGGSLRSNQGINMPHTSIKTPTLTEKDRVDLNF
jgi:pyruvate kinase